MPTPAQSLQQLFRKAITDAFAVDADPQIGPAQNESFGDYQANAAMSLSKTLCATTASGEPARTGKVNPRQVAQQVLEHLPASDIIAKTEIAGPGFINIRLSPAWIASRILQLRRDPRLAIDPVAQPRTIVIDYSGPNIAKEMHVGHLRSTIIGDALSRVLEFQGHRIIRQNHLGDWGTQFGMLIAFLNRTIPAGQTSAIQDLEDFYRQAKKLFDEDPEFARTARDAVVGLQGGDPATLAAWKQIVDETRRHFQAVYDRLKIKLTPADERGESFYNPMLADVVAELLKKGLAVPSQGAIVVNVPGFDTPLIVQKSDGGYLYATTDLAAIRFRFQTLHADRVIYTHDSRQQQHFTQVFWTAQQAGWAPEGSLDFASFGTMLGPDGKPFKTRTGGTVKLRDLLDDAVARATLLVNEKRPDLPQLQREQIAQAVGIGAIKYADLVKDRTSDYMFVIEKMLAMDGNTAPYLQYAHARIRSIFRKGDWNPDDPVDRITLTEPAELALARMILRLGEIIDLVSRELRPHLLCSYLYDLACRFTTFWDQCPVLQSPQPQRTARLVLCDAAVRTLECAMDLLGIEHPDQM